MIDPLSARRKDLRDTARFVHVYPLGEHDGERHVCVGYVCPCGPRPHPEEPRVIVHRRFA